MAWAAVNIKLCDVIFWSWPALLSSVSNEKGNESAWWHLVYLCILGASFDSWERCVILEAFHLGAQHVGRGFAARRFAEVVAVAFRFWCLEQIIQRQRVQPQGHSQVDRFDRCSNLKKFQFPTAMAKTRHQQRFELNADMSQPGESTLEYSGHWHIALRNLSMKRTFKAYLVPADCQDQKFASESLWAHNLHQFVD